MSSQPNLQPAAQLSVALILPDGTHPDGALRLLDHLTDDPRYQISALWSANPPPSRRPLLCALEARVVPLPAPYTPRHWAPATPQPVPDSVETCDVIIDFTHDPATTRLATATRHGLWRLSAYAPDAGSAAAMAAQPTTAVTLDILSPKGTSTQHAHAVYDTKFAARRNAGYIQEKSVQLVIHALARLQQDQTLPPGPTPEPTPAPEPQASLAGYGYRTAREIARRVIHKQRVKAGGNPGGFSLRIGTGDLLSLDPNQGHDLPMPRRHFWADPFLMEHNGQVYCLFEDYDYDTRLGHIGAGVLTDTGMTYLGRAHVVPHHLSFPYLFRHQGQIYMMPETHQAQRLEIWRAIDFPLTWTLHATAFEGQGLADTILFEHQDDWWLLTGYSQDGFNDFCGELHLFRTSGPDLAFAEPHPLNPVVIGADRARGGGRIHHIDNKLYRVSQDNSGGIYGWGINILEITQLSATRYAEHRVRHITPDTLPALLGCHHLDTAGGRWVMDLRLR